MDLHQNDADPQHCIVNKKFIFTNNGPGITKATLRKKLPRQLGSFFLTNLPFWVFPWMSK
jgi:hypothetical protein